MSNLVASQIMNYADVSSRANAIEKWVAVADICRCLRNYNGVLEISSALNRSAIFRLKKTWAKVSKQVRERLACCWGSPGRGVGNTSMRTSIPTPGKRAARRSRATSPLSWSLSCVFPELCRSIAGNVGEA